MRSYTKFNYRKKQTKRYQKRYLGFKGKTLRDLIFLSLFISIIVAVGHSATDKPSHLVTPVATAQVLTAALPIIPTITQTDQPIDSNTTPTQDEIEGYIKRIFTDAADTAIGISHHECSPQNKTYPRCVLHTQWEYSVGIFQINLYNAQQSVHADRIPGTTMDEKIEWLKNPFNNTLYAWWVYSTSGFTPWSTYTSGAYLQ